MKRKICFILALLLISTIFNIPAFAEGQISNELNNVVQQMVNSGKAKGAILSIVKNGEIELCKGYGYADENLGYAADGEKIGFRIGSVSKTFVAAAAQILVQDGMLNMDRDISDYLEPDFPKLSYPVTMHQLLTHTAGFEDIITGIAVYNVSDTEPLAVSVRKYMPKQIYKPGETVSYSNYGIALAAYVIESIVNQDFADFCQEQIFTPLEMRRTTFKYMHDTVYVSKPYLRSGEETLEPYMNLYPEGSAVSTAKDMARYMNWLLDMDDTRVLSSEHKEELFKKQFTMSEEFEGIGYIWNRKSRNNKMFYEKKGETLNFYTRIVLYPQEKTGVFLSFNTYVPESEINAVINKATDLLYGEKQEINIKSGKSNIDIQGLYVNNWSSFKTPEKILRYFTPGKMLYISGSDSNNYSINGKSLTLVSDDMYSSNIGLLKFQNKDDKVLMATEAAQTYVKVPLWQHQILIMIIPLIFLVMTLIMLLREFILMARKKKSFNIIFLLCSLIQIASFIMLSFVIYNGIASFSMLEFTPYMKILGYLIISTVAAGVIAAINKKKYNVLPAIWNISGILFSAWILWFNIV